MRLSLETGHRREITLPPVYEYFILSALVPPSIIRLRSFELDNVECVKKALV